jgi:CheY-like chemotaxis protein
MNNMPTKNYIVYVEDDFDDKELMKELFEPVQEYELVILDDGLDLLQYLDKAEEIPALIILDINMPVIDGKKSIRNLKSKKRYKDIPVVMYSTTTNAQEIQWYKLLGVDVITKPTSYSDFQSITDKFISYIRQ